MLKKKNLDRFETVSQNLKRQAEIEQDAYFEKIKEKKKYIKNVASCYKLERNLQEKDLLNTKEKAKRAYEIKRKWHDDKDTLGLEAYRKHIKEIK